MSLDSIIIYRIEKWGRRFSTNSISEFHAVISESKQILSRRISSRCLIYLKKLANHFSLPFTNRVFRSVFFFFIYQSDPGVGTIFKSTFDIEIGC